MWRLSASQSHPQNWLRLFARRCRNSRVFCWLDESKDKFEADWGRDSCFTKRLDSRYRVSHLSFFQVNRFLVEDLLQTVVAGAKGEAALDLYAGVGFFYRFLSRRRIKRVVSVDANLAATR